MMNDSDILCAESSLGLQVKRAVVPASKGNGCGECVKCVQSDNRKSMVVAIAEARHCVTSFWNSVSASHMKKLEKGISVRKQTSELFAGRWRDREVSSWHILCILVDIMTSP